MTDRPIIFSAPMVRAILDGRKTQTRRILKPRKHASLIGGEWADSYVLDPGNAEWLRAETPYAPGDRLWVREAHIRFDKHSCDAHVWYAAGANDPRDYPAKIAGVTEGDWPLPEGPAGGAPYRVSPIHMPRWASRLTLLVDDVRVQRVQDISGEDAAAEGVEVPRCGCEACGRSSVMCPADASENVMEFARIWDSLHGPGAWDRNPWVAAVTFRAVLANIDAPEAA
jgi:hypothetical protein